MFAIFIISASTQATEKNAKQLYQECIACHGSNGEGNLSLQAPKVAGQQVWYIKNQLLAFKKGLRGAHEDDVLGKQMVSIASSLSEVEILKLSTFVSTLNLEARDQVAEAESKNGYRYYQAKCGACHGGSAQGNIAFEAPKLAGMSNEYLTRQMQYFKTGKRGYAKSDKRGRQMAMMSTIVKDKELGDIIHYVSKL